jgi:hypothetical protein
MSIGPTWSIIATTFGSGINGGGRSEPTWEVRLDFEDFVTALEPLHNHLGTAAQAAELEE